MGENIGMSEENVGVVRVPPISARGVGVQVSQLARKRGRA
jgi:hypothetical protein